MQFICSRNFEGGRSKRLAVSILRLIRSVRVPALAAAATGVLLHHSALAEKVVDFDGVTHDYTPSGNKTLLLPTPTHPAGSNDYIYSYSASTPISPTYDGPLFYGGGWMTSADPSYAEYGNKKIRADFNNATTGVSYQSQIELGMTSHAGIMTTGASFLAFSIDGLHAVDNSSSLNLTISTGSASTVRFAVLSGDQWYLSSISVNPTSTLGGTLSLTGQAFLDSTWAAWDPNGGADGRLGAEPSSYAVLGSSLTGVEAAGVYASYNSTASNQYAYVGQFSADLKPVSAPEPSSALLLVSGISMVAFRRHRGRVGVRC